MSNYFPNEILSRISYIGLFLDEKDNALLMDALQEFAEPSHSVVPDAHVTILHSMNSSDDLSILSLIGQVIVLEAFAFVRGKKALAALVRWPMSTSVDIFSGEAALFVPQISTSNGDDELIDDYKESIISPPPSKTTIDEYRTNNTLVYSTLSKLSSNALSRNQFPHITLFLEDSQSGRVSNEIIRQAVERKRLVEIVPPLHVKLRVGVACYTKEGRTAFTSMKLYQDWVDKRVDKKVETLRKVDL